MGKRFLFPYGKSVAEKTRPEKFILFFDELQWMAAGRDKLISLLKFFWDNHWKEKNVLLILCGSIASFMVKKVLQSKALYGRPTLEMLLKGLTPEDALALLKNKRSKEEVLKYLMVFGGVPKYLEQINRNHSFHQNINRLCFSRNGIMINEIDRVFYNQSKEAKNYLKIVNALEKGIFSLKEISNKTNIPSGGGLRQYLKNLEQADIIKNYTPANKKYNTKISKYILSDEYLIFYFKYIKPNLKTIHESTSKKIFETVSGERFNTWLGFRFENFCIKHAGFLSKLMGFEDEVLVASPYFEKTDHKFQIDLLYKKTDKVITICEIKFHNAPVTTSIKPEMKKKCTLMEIPLGYTVETALISLYGPDKSLKNAEYFNHYITLDDLFK